MLDKILQIDTELLLLINGWYAGWADRLMWIISAKATWIPLYVLLIGLLVWKYRQPSVIARYNWLKRVPVCVVLVVAIVAAVGLADFVSSGILKDLVARPRPTRVPELEGVLHLVNGYRSGQYGFVSSHAANTMACGLLFSLIWRKKIATAGLMLWVAMNCYSRIYLGVHYPLDIIGGLLVGALMAMVAYQVLRLTKVLVVPRCKQFDCKGSDGDEARD